MIDYINLELFNQSSVRKDIDIAYDTDSHITNNDVVSGSFSLNESACSSKELKFGSLVSSKMSVKLYNTVDNLIDKELSVSIIPNKDSNNPLKIGKYTVKSDKPTSDRLYKQIEAYDVLYDVIHKDVSDWYENLDFPLTQKLFRDSLFNYVGLEQVNATLVNDDMVIEKTISANSLSVQQVLSAICELNGAIGRINRDGKFAYVTLNPNPTKRIIIKKIKSKSGSYEDYDCKPISKVQIRQETNDIGAIAGTDGNTYIVQNNFLVYGKSSSDLSNVATNLLSVIQGITYRPFNVTSVYGNPCYEIGDALTVVTRNATFNTYLLNRTLNGIQAMSDKIKADGVEIYTENLNSTNVQFQQLKRQTNVLERTVEKTVSQIASIDKKFDDYSTTQEMQSAIEQSAEEIKQTVSETYTTKSEASGIVDSIDLLSRNMSTTISNNSDEILHSVSENYYLKGETDSLIESVSTELTQTKDSFEFRFNQFSQEIDSVKDGTDAQFQEFSKYIRFEDGNIILGESGNELTLKIQNDRISFLESGVEVAYFTNRKLYITDGEFLNALQLGRFAFIPRTNGNLSFNRISDS